MRIAARRFTLAAMLVLGVGPLLLPPPALAQDSGGWGRDREEEEDPFAKLPPMSPKFQERRDRSLELYYEEKYDEAEQELGKIFLKRLNFVEEVALHETYGYIAAARGDRAEARRRLELAVKAGQAEDGTPRIRPSRLLDFGYKIAMLFLQDENWKEAAEAQEQWFQAHEALEGTGMVEAPNARAYFMLALTYYRMDDFAKALPPARKAVELGDPPDESWLQMLLGIHLIQKEYEPAIPVIEQLVALYPKKGHLVNLSTVYGALGRYEDAAIPLQLAHEQGYLDGDSELRRLAQLLLFLNLPYRAAEVVDRGLEEGAVTRDSEVLAMLANSWIGAREYAAAVAPLEQAASLAENGELYVRLAQVYVQREEWAAAKAALRNALEKGGLVDTGGVHLLMGISLYSEGRPDEARRWFSNARGFESSEAEAGAWLTHIDQELAAVESSEAEAAGG